MWFEALELHQGRGLFTAFTDAAATGRSAILGTNSSSGTDWKEWRNGGRDGLMPALTADAAAPPPSSA